MNGRGTTTYLKRLEHATASHAALTGHFIVCGAGDTGLWVIGHLATVGWPFVVIEADATRCEQVRADHADWPLIEADATDDDALRAAGVARAKGLATLLPQDRDNLVVIVTARQNNPGLRIVSRNKEPDQREKLEKAGARVVSPDAIGGRRIAGEALHPAATTPLNKMLGKGLRLESVQVESGKPYCGKTLRELDVFGRTGMKVLALARPDRFGYVNNPPPETVLVPRMQLFVAGDLAAVRALADLVGETE